MKLFAKYNRVTLLVNMAIFLLSCCSFFLLLRYIFINQIDEDLEIEQREIIAYTKKYNRLPEVMQLHDQQISYARLSSSQHQPLAFKTIRNDESSHGEDFRQLTFAIEAEGENWLVTVIKPLEGTDELLQSVIIITVCTVLLILLVTFFINRILLRKLWQPFYTTLERIKNFKLGDGQMLRFKSSGINEFDRMNDTLQYAINKAAQDYASLKEFTENASHELQTPLAVIRSKLDILIQDEMLSEQQSKAAEEAYEAVKKLNKLNQSLLLLTKIENRQFHIAAELNLRELIEHKIKYFSEFWQNSNLKVQASLDDAVILINADLADILLNNLLGNASRHNVANGAIEIVLHSRQLTISNTGQIQPLHPDLLFTRFYKALADNESHGLGLSIVKQICDVSNISITYTYHEPAKHVFSLTW